ncbi:hypothetical protein X989_5595 [Burkholderia pseudomallei MSHR4378]|nr:hypothetical protein X989_5595 [Burkholderia pseudomallei MSHR4378]
MCIHGRGGRSRDGSRIRVNRNGRGSRHAFSGFRAFDLRGQFVEFRTELIELGLLLDRQRRATHLDLCQRLHPLIDSCAFAAKFIDIHYSSPKKCRPKAAVLD